MSIETIQAPVPSVGAANRDPKSWPELEDYFKPGLIAEVRALVVNQGLHPNGCNYVRWAAESPSRHVRSTVKSISGAYPSKKMGVVIGFESRTLELPFAITAEHDPGTLAYFNQPPKLKVQYRNGNGRSVSYMYTPDYMVVRHKAVVLVECKPVDQIMSRNAKDPAFYVFNGKHWTCPALEAAARAIGMNHEVWTERSFSTISLRNLRMLGDYMSLSSPVEGYDTALPLMREVLQRDVKISISELMKELGEKVCVDHLYAAIAQGHVAFDHRSAPLIEPHQCFVFRDEQAQRAYDLIETSKARPDRHIRPAMVEIAHGALFNWNGVMWTCINPSPTVITLKKGDGTFQEVPRAIVNELIDDGRILVAPQVQTNSSMDDGEVARRIARASPTDLRMGNLRYGRIVGYLFRAAQAPKSRTERRHLAAYKEAEAVYGNGYIGLLPNSSKSGNRLPRLHHQVLDLVLKQVKDNYLNAKNRNVKSVFALIKDECEERSLPPPSYAWLCRFIKKLPAHAVAVARKGRKGAYALEPRQDAHDGVDKMAPERPFERAHIDHTLIDVETLFGETSAPLGRVWCTLMVDQDSRVCLAAYLTYDPPSYRSLLMVMRKCVERWGRLPDSLVIDGGKDMRSIWFETFCALYRITIIRRPIGKGRFGSTVERLFGTVNTNLFHFLAGNTQLTKNVRQMSDEVSPHTHSVWTLPELHRALVKYFYDVYENLEHRELLMTPRQKLNIGMALYGERAQRRVMYNELFRITSSPSTPKGTARVSREGVKINYLVYYHAALQRHIGKDLSVRYDPFDMAVAWAFADGQWLELKSRHEGVLRDLTERDVGLAAAEWRKRRSDVEKIRLDERELVQFLKEIMNTETLLLERRRAAEERKLRDKERRSQEFQIKDEDETLVDLCDDDAAAGSNGGCGIEEAVVIALATRNKPKHLNLSSGFAAISGEIKQLEVL